ncbi:biotin-dependent carboxyltransferase family protein [Leeuwenhoekiella sp. A16]|uniref:5-oxoprolinase subunit C family protein n=1 Tax=unclassified Leeuwenhoekiella TaxID=2615029 RepID=UPI003A7F926A
MSDFIEVLSPGFYSTIQDLGRFGYAKFGVPQSGVMDSFSAKKANLLLNNKQDAAVLEITMTGPVLKFHATCYFALSGAKFLTELNDVAIENDKAYFAAKGSVLRFKSIVNGFRSYLAIKDGFLSDVKLESRSMYDGITDTVRLKKGDHLSVQAQEYKNQKSARVSFRESGIFKPGIEVFTGPEWKQIPETIKQRFLLDTFTVSKTGNRMAIQLDEKLPNNMQGIITGPVVPGTVQLTPAGKLIVLMRDCQVTGGYPRVLQLTEMAINTLAQKRPGDLINFKFK